MNVSTVQERIAEMAKRYPERGLTSLNRYLTEKWLEEAFLRIRKAASSGLDGISAKEYSKRMKERLPEVVSLAKSGRYYAPPVRRVYIEKPGKKEKRRLGIPTVEDKLLQKAVAMLMEPIYETTEFYDFSYGYRPGRSAHDAVKALHHHVTKMGTGWILDVDIRRFFDTLKHDHMREIVRRRVRDGVLTRLIGKWLKAGVLEGEEKRRNEYGTPQGGVISPLLANIYLHEVLDKWYMETVRQCLKGESFLIRYSDDFVLGFKQRSDAERMLKVLPKRFRKYGLEISQEKTRLVDFQRPRDFGHMKDYKSGTFDFLGFTHFWGKNRKGFYSMKHKTAKDRLNRAVCSINRWCQKNRHKPLTGQWKELIVKINGHYRYYGIFGNSRQLNKYREEVRRYWKKWLTRRTRKRNSLNWEAFASLLKKFPLPAPYIACKLWVLIRCETVT